MAEEKRGNILVVDDDVDICEMISLVLEQEGYFVTTASNGYSAIDAVKQMEYDTVIMDVKMPGLNGVETLRELKIISPNVPVIMVTAFAVEDLIRESIKEGAFTTMKKPLDFDLLFSTIEEARGNGGMVLVVDDDDGIRESLQISLEDEGYSVNVALDGNSAMENVRSADHDAIILDMKMPVMNGLEVFLAIREIRPSAFVILISGFPEEMKNLVKSAIEKGAYVYLQKPFDMERLFELLEEIMKQRRSE